MCGICAVRLFLICVVWCFDWFWFDNLVGGVLGFVLLACGLLACASLVVAC